MPTVPSTFAQRRPTSLESTEALFGRYSRGDASVRPELVRRFMPLARRLAFRYANRGESADDLQQVAYLGLIKSIDRYDPRLASFVAYAVPNIIGELKRHFRDKGWGMHVPRALQERVLEVDAAVERLSASLGRSPSPQDLADHTGRSVEEVLEALDAASAYSPAALDAPRGGDSDDDRTLRERLGDDDSHFGLVELGATIRPAFKALPAREQRIVGMRFIEDLTQSEIAERLGISQMHVSRLLRRALARLNAAATR